MNVPGRLYAIVDPCGRDVDPVSIAGDLLEGGARVLQLRWKAADGAELVRAARDILRRCLDRGARLIVNDRVDVALAVGAHGAHLGQDDLAAEDARSLLGGRILGISTHDVAQARRAESAGADYVGFGPMFPTGTKATGYDPRGLEALREVHGRIDIPIVAIGGIRRENARACLEAGAHAVAMISELSLAPDRVSAVRRVLGTLAAASSES